MTAIYNSNAQRFPLDYSIPKYKITKPNRLNVCPAR